MFITWQFISGWRSSLIFTTLGNIHTLEIFIVCLKISRPGGCNGQNEQNESADQCKDCCARILHSFGLLERSCLDFLGWPLVPHRASIRMMKSKGLECESAMKRSARPPFVWNGGLSPVGRGIPQLFIHFRRFFFSDYSEDYHTFLLTKLCDRQSSITYCLVTIKSRWFSRFSLRIHWSILWNIDHCFQRSTFLRLICFISICNHWILRWRMFVQMWSNDHKDYWADFN